jgi:hypothetical protein
MSQVEPFSLPRLSKMMKSDERLSGPLRSSADGILGKQRKEGDPSQKEQAASAGTFPQKMAAPVLLMNRR